MKKERNLKEGRKGGRPGNFALIHQHDCHPVIKTFTNSINGKSYSIKKLPLHSISGMIYAFYLAMKIPNHEAYFTDSVMSNFVPIFKRWFGQKNIIIYRAGDGIFGEKSDAYLYTKNPLKKRILLYVLKNLDGVITESKMSKRDAERWVDCQVEIATSYVEDLKGLKNIRPALDTKKFLFIGDYRPPYDHKGIGILIDAFRHLPADHELYIVGKNTEHLKDDRDIGIIPDNVHIEGRVRDLKEYFRKCTYYVHPAKYETGPITILEAMAAGLIPIVSDNCGHKDIVERIDPGLVLRTSDPKKIAGHIIHIVALDAKRKDEYSRRAKRLIDQRYSKENQAQIFRKNFYRIVKTAGQKTSKT